MSGNYLDNDELQEMLNLIRFSMKYMSTGRLNLRELLVEMLKLVISQVVLMFLLQEETLV